MDRKLFDGVFLNYIKEVSEDGCVEIMNTNIMKVKGKIKQEIKGMKKKRNKEGKED